MMCTAPKELKEMKMDVSLHLVNVMRVEKVFQFDICVELSFINSKVSVQGHAAHRGWTARGDGKPVAHAPLLAFIDKYGVPTNQWTWLYEALLEVSMTVLGGGGSSLPLGGWSYPGGRWSCPGGRWSCPGGSWTISPQDSTYPPPFGQTDVCENITFAHFATRNKV